MLWGSLKLPPPIRGGGAAYNTIAYLNDHFAFICIHLKIKQHENKTRMKFIQKGVRRGIHEMQISDKWQVHLFLFNISQWYGVVANCAFVVQLRRVCSGFRRSG